MKAIVSAAYGTPDVLEQKEVEKPIPKENEVLIKVHASSINSWDWDILTGRPLVYRLLFGLLKPKWRILGADIAGRVEAVGRNVSQLQIGDEVFGDISGCSWGGFAEYVCADEKALALKSKHMSFEQAAAIPQAGVLALQGLRLKGQFEKGQQVLINGAGGGVGTFAIQMIKSFGAEVTAVDSMEKLEMLSSIGADHVIDYKQEDFTKNRKQYDLILDVMANRSIYDCRRALSPTGRYVVIGGTVLRMLQLALMKPWIAMKGKKITFLMHQPNKKDLDVMSELFESGKVVPVIDRCYRLQDVPQAFRYFGKGHVKGKVVITCVA